MRENSCRPSGLVLLLLPGLAHREQAEQFYRELKQRNICARVGMESSGHSRWFERLLHGLGFELWIGDP